MGLQTRRRVRLLLGAAGIAVLVGVWWAVSSVLDQALILPGPAETVGALFTEVASGAFAAHLGATALRAILGFAASLVTGIIWGVAAGRKPRVRAFLSPALVLIRSIPVIAVILLAIIWFSPNLAPILVTWLMVMPVVEQVIEQGIRNTEPALLEMARIFRVSPNRVLRDLHFPAIAPFIRAASHSGLGMAYKVTVAAEVLVQPPWSLGGAMQEARFYLDTPRILALTLTVVILSGLTEALLRGIDRMVGNGRRAKVPRAVAKAAEATDGPYTTAEKPTPMEQDATAEPVARLRGVCKAFDDLPVLNDVDLDIAAGQVTVLVGPSGCGKTTLLRVLAGLETAESGAVEMPPGAALSMVFQEPRVLPWRSCARNVSFVAPDATTDEIAGRLAAVGLGDFEDLKPAVLSGGMVQRLSLARAHAVDADIVLMDEPFQNLDLRTRLKLGRTVRRLQHERQCATVFVTHDSVEAALIADRIVMLSDRPARPILSLPNPLPEDARDPRDERVQSVVTRLYEVLLSSSQQ